MHMISKKDLNSAELETVTTSISPTTVIKANDAWRSHSLCQGIEYILDNGSHRGFASSFIARKALRWTRILIRMDNRSKTTSHWKRYSETGQFWELRSDRGSWLIGEFSLNVALLNINDTFKAGNWSSQVFLKLVHLTNHDIFNCVKRKCC